MPVCAKCGEEKPREAFRKDTRLSTKHDRTCAACRQKGQKAKRQARRDQDRGEAAVSDEAAAYLRAHLRECGCQVCKLPQPLVTLRAFRRWQWVQGQREAIIYGGKALPQLKKELGEAIIVCGRCYFTELNRALDPWLFASEPDELQARPTTTAPPRGRLAS